MNTDETRVFVDARVVVLEAELLVHRGEDPHLVRLRLDAKIVVPRIMPAADVESRNDLTRFESRQRAGTLHIAIEVVRIGPRHPRVVEVVDAVPDTVLLLHAHVTHLHREEVVNRGLPGAHREDVVRDPERRCAIVSVADDVHSRPRDLAEVEVQVPVAKKVAPYLRRLRDDGVHTARFVDPLDTSDARAVVPRVQLDHRYLALPRMVADLRDLHDRRFTPSRDDVRPDDPLDRSLRRPGGHEGPHDKPAVVVLDAAVEELQVARATLDCQALRFRLRRHGQSWTARKRRRLHLSTGISALRTTRLAGKDSGAVTEVPALAEKIGRIELEVEADATNPLSGNRRVKIDDDAYHVSLATHADVVRQIERRIGDRIEPVTILARVRVRERRHDLVVLPIDDAASLDRNGLPLAGRRLEANVSVTSNTNAMLDDAHTALMSFRVDVLKGHDVRARAPEVPGRRETESGRRRT